MIKCHTCVRYYRENRTFPVGSWSESNFMTLVLVTEFKSDCMPVFKSLGMHIAAQERIRLTSAQTRSEGRQFSKSLFYWWNFCIASCLCGLEWQPWLCGLLKYGSQPSTLCFRPSVRDQSSILILSLFVFEALIVVFTSSVYYGES